MNFMENESAQKLRGGYYTPQDLATFLARWVNDIRPGHVLEPSCGDGVFFEALAQFQSTRAAQVTSFELEVDEAAKANARATAMGLVNIQINNTDFLGWAIEKIDRHEDKFDAVVGNPPFIRYQYLPELFQLRAENVFKQLNLRFTKHTNAWVPFVAASISLLRQGGRLAMVVPSEIIHVTHAQSLREYLTHECSRVVVIDPEELWFDNTLQGAVILLAEKKRGHAEVSQGIGIYPVKGRAFLNIDPSFIFSNTRTINGKSLGGKWTRALLGDESLAILDEVKKNREVFPFSDIAQVDVGIVTGANKFFLVPDEVVKEHGLENWAHPMFGRSEHCPGIIYDNKQHKENSRKGSPTNFIWFTQALKDSDQKAKAYIEFGESQKLHTRYKCRIRRPWYSVPSVYATEVGMLKRSHHSPKLILNRIGAYTTDTAYRIRTTKVAAEKLVGCFFNPLTALSAELEGRHYGGGVLELVPSEIERLLLPLPANLDINVTALDQKLRTQSTEATLREQGRLILGAIGLEQASQENLLGSWRKLRDRRHRTSEESIDE